MWDRREGVEAADLRDLPESKGLRVLKVKPDRLDRRVKRDSRERMGLLHFFFLLPNRKESTVKTAVRG